MAQVLGFGFHEDLVDYKADRPLTGEGAAPIESIIPGIQVHAYGELPFMDELHAQQGTSWGTSPEEFLASRKEFFNSLPTTQVPINTIVATQDNINVGRVQEMADNWMPGAPALFFVNHNGGNYLLNGHHRMVAQYLTGAYSVDGKVLRV
jgi:hypothetical protein